MVRINQGMINVFKRLKADDGKVTEAETHHLIEEAQDEDASSGGCCRRGKAGTRSLQGLLDGYSDSFTLDARTAVDMWLHPRNYRGRTPVVDDNYYPPAINAVPLSPIMFDNPVYNGGFAGGGIRHNFGEGRRGGGIPHSPAAPPPMSRVPAGAPGSSHGFGAGGRGEVTPRNPLPGANRDPSPVRGSEGRRGGRAGGDRPSSHTPSRPPSSSRPSRGGGTRPDTPTPTPVSTPRPSGGGGRSGEPAPTRAPSGGASRGFGAGGRGEVSPRRGSAV
ncbi:MAG: hypothetical protein O2897_03370 [bacterium]|nr:hypothetical protein [bacterium]